VACCVEFAHFLFPSNGEGYGLPPREAMCTGLPVIMTNWSSLTDICKPDISYWVDSKGLQKAELPAFLATHNDGSTYFGEYAKIAVEDLAEQMLHVYKHRDEALKKGKQASKWVRTNETYEQSAKRLISLMERKS